MRISKLFLAIILTILISGLYAVFQSYLFDSFIAIPLLVSFIIAIVFIRLVKFEKYKMIICGLLIGLTAYSVFIGASYQLFQLDIRNKIQDSSYTIGNVDEVIDEYLYFETGHKGLSGYMLIRTKRIPLTMVDVYERAERSGIHLTSYNGIIGEIFRPFAMIFIPVLCSLPSVGSRRVY